MSGTAWAIVACLREYCITGEMIRLQLSVVAVAAAIIARLRLAQLVASTAIIARLRLPHAVHSPVSATVVTRLRLPEGTGV